MTIRQCSCGSGHERYELNDSAGIFCAYVCEKCEETVRKRFNPAIFEPASRYASTGEEADIGIDEDANDADAFEAKWTPRLAGDLSN